MLTYADARQVSELLSGIRVLKYFSWERPAMEKVMQVRHKEMTTLWRFGLLGALQGVLWHSTTAFVALAIFGTYTYLGNRYPVYLPYCVVWHSTTAFVALAIFGTYTHIPRQQVPSLLALLLQKYKY